MPEQAAEISLWSGKDTSLRQKLLFIKSAFDDCAVNHPECKPLRNHYPGRLIDVGDEARNPRLIETSNRILQGASYATLSHCWGSVHSSTATVKNIKQLCKEIPLDSLPLTFREAILVTRELNIPYIWIDSLCILQDDREDWSKEANKMKYTYSSSAITISALDAENCTYGCFVKPDSDIFSSVRKRAQVTQFSAPVLGTHVPMQIRVQGGDIRHPQRAILRTRGWTLQEELLSHREIACMRPEIRWRCQRAQITEAGHVLEGTGTGKGNCWTQHGSLRMSRGELSQLWCGKMNNYSSREFTFEQDMLSALVGVVDHFGKRTGYTHVLASWRETMIDDLLWIRLRRDIAELRTPIYGIPSWSWLTRAKCVDFDCWKVGLAAGDENISKDHTTVVEVGSEWAGEPMLSAIVNIHLVLEGPMKRMRLRVDPRARDFNPPYLNVGDEEPDLGENPLPWRCAGQFDRENVREDEMFTCILMRSAWRAGRRDGDFLLETFLMLLPEQEEGVFRRVGLGTFRSGETLFGDAESKKIRLV